MYSNPRYLAPEVLAPGPIQPSDPSHGKSQPQSGPKSDIWSLGIIVLEICLGIRLWSACTLQQLISKVLLLAKLKQQQHPLDSILKEHDGENKFQVCAYILSLKVRLLSFFYQSASTRAVRSDHIGRKCDQISTDAIIFEHALAICDSKICQLVTKQQYCDYHKSLKLHTNLFLAI